MPRLEPDTPLLDLSIRTHFDAEGRELKVLDFKFGAIQLQSHHLDAAQVNSLLRELVSGKPVAQAIIPIDHMTPLCIPKQLRAGVLTLGKVKPRRSM